MIGKGLPFSSRGPDPASDLLPASREMANRSRRGTRSSTKQDQVGPPSRSTTALGLVRPLQEELVEPSTSSFDNLPARERNFGAAPRTAPASTASWRPQTPITGYDSLYGVQQSEHRVDLNETRLLQHEPFDSATRQSVLGLFSLPRERQELVSAMEQHSHRPVTSYGWGELQKMKKTGDLRKGRPFYWSHNPEPSVYLHSRRGEIPLKPNKHYRALPYGKNLTPAAEYAYGASSRTPSISLGHRSLQKVKMDPQMMTASAELAERSDFMDIKFAGARTLTGFY